jgi:hypothetical protein
VPVPWYNRPPPGDMQSEAAPPVSRDELRRALEGALMLLRRDTAPEPLLWEHLEGRDVARRASSAT